MTDVFLPGVFAGMWYNNQRENQTMYIGNKRSVLVGMPRARQLRVEPSKFWYFLFSSYSFLPVSVPHQMISRYKQNYVCR